VSEFSLRALAHEAWNDLGGCDYHILAKEIHRRIAAKDRDAALDEALVVFAREFASNLSPAMHKTTGAGQRNSARSAKVSGIRRTWPQLRAHIFTRDGQKAIGKCTAADLVFHAELLEKKAGELTTRAGRERELAALLGAHKVKLVEQLPDDVLGEFFTGRAAA